MHGFGGWRGTWRRLAAVLLLGTGALPAQAQPPPAQTQQSSLAPPAQAQQQALPAFSVAATREHAVEGEVIGFRISVSSGAVTQPLALRYMIEQGLMGRVLAAPGPGAITLQPGYTGSILSIATAGDDRPEPNTSVAFALSPGDGYTLNPAARNADTLVLDDDTQPYVVVRRAESVTEGGQLVFPILLYHPQASGNTITVRYATADHRARAGQRDYAAASGTLTFQPGEREKRVTVQTLQDTALEPLQSLILTLSSPAQAKVDYATRDLGAYGAPAQAQPAQAQPTSKDTEFS